MGIIRLTNEQIAYLVCEFPNLNYDKVKNAINGILYFDLKFGNDGETIIDEYQIEIDLNNVSEYGIPIVRETANRILNIALQKKNHQSTYI